MMPKKQSTGEKLMNDYLFATSRYIDDKGLNALGPVVARDLSSPRLKTEALSTAAMSFMFAALGSPTLALVNTIALPVNLITSWAMHIQSERKNEPYYYFDTLPQRKIPLTDEGIIHDLQKKMSSLKARLLFSTALYSTFAAITYSYSAQTEAAPLAPVMIAMNASFAIARGTDVVGDWWRSKMALEGKWNVLTSRPEAETAPQRQNTYSTAPQPDRG